MTDHVAKPEHEATYQDMIAMIGRHPDLSPMEILAVAANMVGKLIAMQDQRTTSVDMAMKCVAKNIEIGNAQAMAQVQGKASGSA